MFQFGNKQKIADLEERLDDQRILLGNTIAALRQMHEVQLMQNKSIETLMKYKWGETF